jgi:AcrR family transcriptional regulator
MTKLADTQPHKRHYDAAASRQALLHAAAELFDERGYERATIREIGERAGVDPALIARYFGGKEGLYLAALSDPESTRAITCSAGEPSIAVRDMLRRWDERGSTPFRRALMSHDPTPEVREQVGAMLAGRLLSPMVEELERRGYDDAVLRAQIALALATGVELLRENGLLRELTEADLETVLAVVEPMLRALEGQPRGS